MVYKADMGEVVETAEQKFKRHEDALAACMIEITRLREENTRLRAEKSDALSVCREVYSDPKADPALRLRAAGLALPHETPRLAPVEAPLDLVAEPIEPLADVVTRQRARMERMWREDPQFRGLRSHRAIELKPNSNGSGSDDTAAG
jgi:hypothetical protein